MFLNMAPDNNNKLSHEEHMYIKMAYCFVHAFAGHFNLEMKKGFDADFRATLDKKICPLPANESVFDFIYD